MQRGDLRCPAENRERLVLSGLGVQRYPQDLILNPSFLPNWSGFIFICNVSLNYQCCHLSSISTQELC